jgi:HPt (histidine-containing phosphotransfer) domain-containing protein
MTEKEPLLPVFDLDDALERVDGDRAFLQQLIEVFYAGSADSLAKIHQALDTNRGEALAEAAHALKGALGNLSAIRSHDYARALEIAGKSKDFETARTIVPHLEEALDKFYTRAKQELKF